MSNKVSAENRDQIIVRTSFIGILTNIALAIFKAAVGLYSHSIAILLDAVNNLSDALSSVITIVGTRLAGKAPDRRHPFGYGRIEYLSATIISVIVLYAGITSLTESVKKIIHPEKADYSAAALLIVAVAVIVKLLLGRFVKKTGEAVHSGSLIASGSDAMLDSVISASTLAAAMIYLVWGMSLEAVLGAVISLVIVRSGCQMLTETLSKILGERVDGVFSQQIKDAICQTPGVEGAYDLILHDYGPDRYLGSVHIEVPDHFTAEQIDVITRDIQERIYESYHIIMAAVGVYSINTKNDECARIREDVRRLVMSHENVLQMHGFFLNPEEHYMSFDVVISYQEPDRRKLYGRIVDEVQERYPDYRLQVNMDASFTD